MTSSEVPESSALALLVDGLRMIRRVLPSINTESKLYPLCQGP